MNTFEVPSSATLPSMSSMTQLSNPRAFASNSARAFVRIEAAGLGVDRRALEGRLAVGRQADGRPARRQERRLVEAQAPARRIRIGADAARRAVRRPVHRPDV